jgi:hypothetical protein
MAKTCNVIGFNRDDSNPVVMVATAYDAPNGEIVIIILSQALYLVNMISYSLICPNQLRHNGVIVDDIPRHLSSDHDKATHSIYVPDENFRIPLEMRGVVLLFHTRQPTAEELETCRWLMFTSEAEWDPHSEDFMQNELVVSHIDISANRSLFTMSTLSVPFNLSETDVLLSDISSVYSEELFSNYLNINPTYSHQEA